MRSLFLSFACLPLAACAAGGNAPPRTYLQATLTGTQVAPGPGDADGTGTAEIRVEPARERFCYRLGARQLGGATAAHVHRGSEGVAGPEVVTLSVPGESQGGETCQPIAADLAAEIAFASHRFYVDVHSIAAPAGAIRGQLRGAPPDRSRVQRPVR
jgi:hypothetical protein